MAFDGNSSADLTALFNEIVNDLEGLGYFVLTDPIVVPDPAHDADNAQLLNNISTTIQVDRTNIPTIDVVQLIDVAEYNALNDAQKVRLNFYLSKETIGNMVMLPDGTMQDSETKNALLGLFGAGSTTRANLVKLLQKPASRAEALFGEGSNITPSDVANARNANS